MRAVNTTPSRFTIWCPEGDLNPHDWLRSADFKLRTLEMKYESHF